MNVLFQEPKGYKRKEKLKISARINDEIFYYYMSQSRKCRIKKDKAFYEIKYKWEITLF